MHHAVAEPAQIQEALEEVEVAVDLVLVEVRINCVVAKMIWSSSSHILQDEVDSAAVVSRETMALHLLFSVCYIPVSQVHAQFLTWHQKWDHSCTHAKEKLSANR